ncbi:transmembrane amino acid transporter protein-domain-containing protein [Mycena amicta]|nr:transmembrane amino acid transporter protein-domain-containing protein [Mycena amicta]
MSSLPNSFYIGSATSGQSVVRDVISSYRRAQYLVAGSTVASVSDDSDPFSEEDPFDFVEEGEADSGAASLATTPTQRTLSASSTGTTSHPLTKHRLPRAPQLPFSRQVPRPVERQERTERTPLLRKTISFTNTPHPKHDPNATLQVPGTSSVPQNSAALRRPSAASGRSMKYNGQSTFGQTLFNSIAILLGIGMLSEPLAFAYAGWGMGLCLIIFYGYISCYTAKILAGLILSDPRLPFGPRSTVVISILFCLELFAVSVILVTLYADSLNSLIPRYSLIPTVFLPLALLSYTSILGILSTIIVLFVLLVDGVSKTERPGSLWSPARHFSGHAVIPSLARDMIDPSEFDKMIDWAFVVATSIYALIGCAGYLMFGNSVSAEISMDLLATAGYNAALNQAALWMLVLSPLSKFALTTQPLNTAIEILLKLDRPLGAPEDLAAKLAEPRHGSRISFKNGIGIIQRVVVTLLSVAVSIYVPEFSAASTLFHTSSRCFQTYHASVAFLGSFSAFVLCVIGPIAAKVALSGRCGLFDGAVGIMAVVMGVWGTYAAFLSADV